MKILRIFPRATRATPTDENVRIGTGPGMFDEADLIQISVTFSWDVPAAELLDRQWRVVAPVEIGGPAVGSFSGEFEPGRFIRDGYVITSRGCPNSCWFCAVPRREGGIRELEIKEGWNVLDDNLLACSDEHVAAVFEMLGRQSRRAEFTGGLEAARLKSWHVARLRSLHPKQMFFAYDTPDDLEPLREAGSMLLGAGFTRSSHVLRCYVLCGWPRDTMAAANERMEESLDAGFTPMAMLWRNRSGQTDSGWRKFQREWARPAIIHARAEVV